MLLEKLNENKQKFETVSNLKFSGKVNYLKYLCGIVIFNLILLNIKNYFYLFISLFFKNKNHKYKMTAFKQIIKYNYKNLVLYNM